MYGFQEVVGKYTQTKVTYFLEFRIEIGNGVFYT